MAHVPPNKKNGYKHQFVCNTCQKVAGEHQIEAEALAAAREKKGWKWFHPGWGLICPSCQSS